MDLPLFTNGTKNTKPWLNIKCNSIEAKTADIDLVVIDEVEAKSITLVSQVSVPNPSAGSVTLFNEMGSEILTTTNSLGDTVQYLQNPSSVDLDMDGFEIVNVEAITVVADRVLVGNNTATGTQVVGVGVGALEHCTKDEATAVGYQAMQSHTSGLSSSAFGWMALRANTTGGGNTALGHAVLSASTGANNTGCGANSLRNQTAGDNNTGCGTSALLQNLTGNNNTAIGQDALSQNLSGNGNTAVGNGNSNSLTAVDDTVSLGNNCRPTIGKARVLSSGAVCVNNVANTWIFGDASVASVYPANNGICDLGMVGSLYRNVYATGVVGTTSNNNASAGNYGEYITLANINIALTTATPFSVASIALTPGDWDVSGSVGLALNPATTLAEINVSVNDIISTPSTNGNGNQTLACAFTTGAAQALAAPVRRFNINANTTVYLVVRCVFAVNTCLASGNIRARRIR